MRHFICNTIGCLALLCTAGPIAASPTMDAHEASDFYQPPSELPAGPSGTVIRRKHIASAAALGNANNNWLIMYKSKDSHNNPIAVTGTVAFPAGHAPAGGWPIISWGHGTTGTADQCAPSRDDFDFPDKHYVDRINTTLAKYVADGYVVAKTDYAGLGSPGPHPYLIGGSEARSMTDIIRAARNIDSSVSRRWLAMGHSQGGGAAIFTAGLGLADAPELDLVGAVAIAPASQLAVLPQYLKQKPNASAPALLPLLLQGAAAGANVFDPATILTRVGQKKLKLADHQCVPGLRKKASWGALKVQDVIKKNADLSGFADILNDLGGSEHVQPVVPLLVIQATNDRLVTQPTTDKTVAELCHLSKQIRYNVYTVKKKNLHGSARTAGHRGAVEASLADTREWIKSRFNDEAMNPNCFSAQNQ